MSFSCPLRFLLRGSGFLFGAVLAVPSVPQGCLRTCLGVPLRTARGTQKGPPYRRDLLFLGSLWGPFGVLSGVSHAFLVAHSPDKLEVGLRSCTARACLGRLLETLVFYEVLGEVRGWRAGLGGGLGGSRGLSWGLSGAHRDPQGGLQRRLWQLLGDSGDLWGSWGASAGLWGALGVSGDS